MSRTPWRACHVDKVQCIYINKHRNFNTPLIFGALQAQTVPLHLVLLECSPDSDQRASDMMREIADEVIEIDPASDPGPAIRFMATAGREHEFPYTYFQVDDWLPGWRCVESLLNRAKQDEHWATIGQEGRVVRNGCLSGKRIREGHCDVIITNELARTVDLQAAVDFREEMRTECHGASLWEDDMLLCFGIQRKRKRPSVVVRPGEGESWRVAKLPAPNALCGRPDHQRLRDEFVVHAKHLGWKSFAGVHDE